MNFTLKSRLSDKQKLAPRRKSGEKFGSSKNIGVDSIIDSGFHKSIQKKMCKRRSNLENLCGEWYISFQKLLSTEMRKI